MSWKLAAMILGCAFVWTGGPASVRASEPDAPANPTPYADFVASLERTGCYGFCPVYRVTIWRDGSVLFQGRRFVREVGDFSSAVPRERVARLIAELQKADFFGQHEARTCAIDVAGVKVFAKLGDRVRAVGHQVGCQNENSPLLALEAAIERVAGTDRWLWSSSQLQAQFNDYLLGDGESGVLPGLAGTRGHYHFPVEWKLLGVRGKWERLERERCMAERRPPCFANSLPRGAPDVSCIRKIEAFCKDGPLTENGLSRVRLLEREFADCAARSQTECADRGGTRPGCVEKSFNTCWAGRNP